MNRIIFTDDYKSLAQFECRIPDFVVITGLNGSGKTQLLEAINANTAVIVDGIGSKLFSIKYYPSNSLLPKDDSPTKTEDLNRLSERYWNIYKKNHKYLGASFSSERRPSDFQLTPYNLQIFEFVAKSIDKDISDLEENDFYEIRPLIVEIADKDVFNQQLSLIFKNYQDKIFNNIVKTSTGGEGKHLNSEEFIIKNGEPPWDFANRICIEAQLNYEFDNPTTLNIHTPFDLQITNLTTGARIRYNDLSSGERIIMSLVLARYNSEHEIEFPQLILLDEIDSSLHPLMTKQLLDVIEKVFVNGKGVKVIMTTHSPSTVALAPEESVFVINKNERRLEKTTKDKALKILLEGVPSLSVNYQNRRQVFVESENDVCFYGKFYEKLKSRLISEISLNFISSGIGNTGNCSQVQEVVNQLVGFGNKYIFGIIDWDNKNNGNKYVKVLGDKNRYSIENYIFDPILIAAFLLLERFISRKDLQLSNNETYIDFKNLEVERLQTISNFITNKIEPLVNSADPEISRVQYVSGITLEIPKWYLVHQGHNLESHLKTKFPELNRFTKEGDLKKQIINKVVDDIPDFIPTDILDVFRSIQIT